MKTSVLTRAIVTLVPVSLLGLCRSFPIPLGRESKYRSNAIAARTLYEDERKGPSHTPKRERPRIPVLQYHDDWVCVNKPAGMTVHRSKNTSRRQLVLSTLLKRQLARKVFPVHRLDHRTSGAILFAFDSETCGLLHKSVMFGGEEFTNTTIDTCKEIEKLEHDQKLEGSNKNYVALVRGDWRRKFGDDEVVTVSKPLNVKGEIKDAKTEFRLLSSSAGDDSESYSPAACSLLLCTPKTGRTHQIRRHSYAMGFPIIGDSQHGDSKINRWWRQNRSLDRLFLHCISLDLPPLSTFDDSRSKERINCVAPLHPELVRVLAHEDMNSLWGMAKEKDPRLRFEFTDDRGGTFGRNYKSSQVAKNQCS